MNSQIILIDDNSADNVLHEKIIRAVNENANVSIIHNGEEALHYLKRQFDGNSPSGRTTIFLDERMPDRGGLDVLSKIEEMNINFPDEVDIYFLTNDTSEGLIERANRHANVRRVIHKPLTAAAIEDIVSGGREDDGRRGG